MLTGKRVLLVISGGIAAFKALDLIRRLRAEGCTVRCIMTAAAGEFVTPLSVAALSAQPVYQDIFSLKDESEMGHIQLSREADLVVVAPATANIIAKMAAGIADDLASTTLLATDKPILIAPAMNVRMWHHAATQRNVDTLRRDGVRIVGPARGELADGESGEGRLVEPADLVTAIADALGEIGDATPRALAGRRALVTSGPTHEPIDPVRYIANRSSGRQGHAIAAALARLGAETILVSGPTDLPDPPGVTVRAVENARAMLAACEAALPVDVAVCAAAVADWRVATETEAKIKKSGAPPQLTLVENPDILATLSRHPDRRPTLVVGFAAETDAVAQNAAAKRVRKGCDWIVANSVAAGATFGADDNTVSVIDAAGQEDWPRLSKVEVAERLAARIAKSLGRPS
ncbi:MAG: bifunctional phosphopantothenoylcysteine decarboxylase/phosphopantothenate--cysteine ligase CoaBC [Alphaproteobacteria bacterium]|nr:bifunctional phosphopantothenoylcysteine decarboxylase/phosphopantothenate--cysteine ligase CoaBC [Alphaproteobacteria bacterium]